VETIKNQVVMETTIAEQMWTDAFGAQMEQIAACFPRREPRLVARKMVQARLAAWDI
jgi:hypothetical protein